MKKIVALTLAVAALAVPAAQTSAATNEGPTLAQFKALQKQVSSLQAQVKSLQKWVPKSCSAKTCFTLPVLSDNAAFTYAVEICQEAVLADEFQATWNVIDQIAAATQAGKVYFGPQTAIADKSACTSLQLARSTVSPPNVSIFSSLVTLLTGTS
jgi:hypothetical protein